MAGEHIIVVKRKKGGHGGGHGGAWKVAFADFMTAMMAFFLVMWLVGQSKPIKVAVASYFRNPGAFDTKAGGDGLLDGGKQSADAPEKSANGSAAEREQLELRVSRIRERLDSLPELKTLRKQIEFTITSEGLRIDLLEAEKSNFFESGSAGLRPETGRILGIIAKELGTLNNSIIIEGHTDSHQYASPSGYTNWELSADRANAARRVMQTEGLRKNQVAFVRGHADHELRVAADPFDARNRRVSVIVRTQGK